VRMSIVREKLMQVVGGLALLAEIVADGLRGGPRTWLNHARDAISDTAEWIKVKRDPNLTEKRAWVLAAAEGNLEELKRLSVATPQHIDAMLPGIAFTAAQGACAEMTPLMMAIQSNWIDCVKFLIPLSNLDSKKRAVRLHKGGHTAMMLAALNGNPEVVDAMLRAVTAEQLNARNGFGATPLLGAVTFGRLVAARKIIADPRCDRQAKDELGNDALLVAMQSARPESVAMVAPFSTPAQREAAVQKGMQIARDWRHAPLAIQGVPAERRSAQWACVDELLAFTPVSEALGVFAQIDEHEKKWIPKGRALMEMRELRRAIAHTSVGVATAEEEKTKEKAAQKSGMASAGTEPRERKTNRL